MADYKKSRAPQVAVTQDIDKIEMPTGNVYESVMVIARRSNQIGLEMKQELNRKLEEFAYYTDNLEEIFENREQIEISKFYERLPKPTLIALQEFLDQQVYYRNPSKSGEEETKPLDKE
jgi:DNA-directed RNA polymerase subunit K/omega